MEQLHPTQLSDTISSTHAILYALQIKHQINDLTNELEEVKPQAIQEARLILRLQGKKTGMVAQNDFGKATIRQVSPTSKDLELDLEYSNIQAEIEMEADRLALAHGEEVRQLKDEIEELTAKLWKSPLGKKILGLTKNQASLLSSPELRKLEAELEQRTKELKETKKDQIAFELS